MVTSGSLPAFLFLSLSLSLSLSARRSDRSTGSFGDPAGDPLRDRLRGLLRYLGSHWDRDLEWRQDLQSHSAVAVQRGVIGGDWRERERETEREDPYSA